MDEKRYVVLYVNRDKYIYGLDGNTRRFWWQTVWWGGRGGRRQKETRRNRQQEDKVMEADADSLGNEGSGHCTVWE